MLRRLSDEIAACHERAALCAERAKSLTDPEMRNFYLQMEQRWIKLARSYSVSETLEPTTGNAPDIDRRHFPSLP